MITLEVFGDAPAMTAVAQRLQAVGGVSRLRVEPALGERSLVLARVSHDATDQILAELRALHVPREDIMLTRVEELGGDVAERAAGGLIWADVVGLAGTNARLISHYIAFMAVAGVIAAYGVMDANPILIVGAMAVSPDLLPITAMAVGLIGRSLSLVAKALLTLTIGMAVASLFAALVTVVLRALAILPPGLNIAHTLLHGLSEVDSETIVVAFAAGVAGMLALETRASSGVGVAISVTTIPAAAYLGVALGLGHGDQALGALAVLSTNVALIVTGAAITLGLQRLADRRRAARARRRARPTQT
jgi:uncharacterized hydrophobic protein (TIGR00271 family)